MLEIGEKAPDFTSKDHLGQSFSLKALLEEGPVVLFFYPRDFTPVCTREACHFEDAREALNALSAQVIGVSGDDSASHQGFAQAHNLTYRLVSDPNRTLARDYQTLGMFSRPLRVTYVIGQTGRIEAALHYELRAKRHVEDVKAVLSRLAQA